MLQRFQKSPHTAPGFHKDEDGGMTALGIYIFLAAAVISAIGVDFSYLMSSRTQLQNTADSVAHAALYYREEHTAAEAQEVAIALAESEMSQAVYGNVANVEDVIFGDWDYSTETFTADPDGTSKNAVRVITRRSGANSNSANSYLFQLVGLNQFDVVAESIFTTFYPTCFREGIVGMGVVDIQSNNGFANGFCVHSNAHVELNSNNTFEAGTIVSMPDSDDVVLPRSGFEKNEGLQAALREGYYRPRILDKMDEILHSLNHYPFGSTDENGDLKWIPEYITHPVVEWLDVNDSPFDQEDFTDGAIHKVSCNWDDSSNHNITISPSDALHDVALLTNCKVNIANNSVLENVLIATTSTDAESISSPSSLQVGRDDNCAPGGGAQLLTMGGMKFAAGLMLYGGQLIAQHDIDFTANADGIMGASIIAGGRVDGESNMQMAFCNDGMEHNYEAAYFRLAK